MTSFGKYVFSRKTTSALLAGVTLSLSVLGTIVGSNLWRRANPITLEINSVSVRDGNLIVDETSQNPKDCIRTLSHVMYQDTGGVRTYRILGSAVSAGPFPSSIYHYRVILPLPAGATGDWEYTVSTSYECPPFGLVRGAFFVVPPVLLHLGPPALAGGPSRRP